MKSDGYMFTSNMNTNMNVSQHYPLSINFYYLPLGLLSFMAIFGNLMVIISVIVEKRLRALATNRFVASLALSDLLVGAMVMPFGVYIKMNNNSWDLGRTWCQFHLSSTVFSTAASILNLVAISIDRYFAIIFPTEYQRHSLRAKSAPYIVMVWLISSAVSAPIFMEKIVLDQGTCWIEDPQYMIMSALLTFFIPAFIITYLYSKIFKRIRKHLNLFWAGAKRRGFSATTLPQVIVEEVRSRRNSRIENNSSPSGSLSITPSARKLSTEEPSMGPRSRFSSVGACSLDVPLVDFMQKPANCEIRRMSISSTENLEKIIQVPAADRRNRSASKSKFHFHVGNAIRKNSGQTSNSLSLAVGRISYDLLLSPKYPLAGSPATSSIVAAVAAAPVPVQTVKYLAAPGQKTKPSTPPPKSGSDSLTVTTAFLLSEKKTLKLPQMNNISGALSQSESGLITANINNNSNSLIAGGATDPQRHISFNNVSKQRENSLDLRRSIYILPSRGSTVSGISTPGTLSSVTSQSSEDRKSSMFSYGSSLDDDYFDMMSAGSSRKSSGLVGSGDRAAGLPGGGGGISADDGEKSNKKSNVLHTSGNKLRRIAQQVTRAIRRKRRESQAIRRETRATRVVAAILAVFILCWLPYFCGTIIRSINSSTNLKFEYHVYLLTSWLGYSHSCFNCVIYTFLNKIFRSTFKRLLCFWTLRKKRY